MSNKPPLPNSALNRTSPAPAAAAPAGGATPKILALLFIIAAGVIAFLVRDRSQIIAGAALVGTVVAFGIVFLRSQKVDDEEPAGTDDAAAELARTLEKNRAEYASRIAELKKSLEACKVDKSAAQENEAIRQEIGKLRAELAGIRGAVAQR